MHFKNSSICILKIFPMFTHSFKKALRSVYSLYCVLCLQYGNCHGPSHGPGDYPEVGLLKGASQDCTNYDLKLLWKSGDQHKVVWIRFTI